MEDVFWQIKFKNTNRLMKIQTHRSPFLSVHKLNVHGNFLPCATFTKLDISMCL